MCICESWECVQACVFLSESEDNYKYQNLKFLIPFGTDKCSHHSSNILQQTQTITEINNGKYSENKRIKCSQSQLIHLPHSSYTHPREHTYVRTESLKKLNEEQGVYGWVLSLICNREAVHL